MKKKIMIMLLLIGIVTMLIYISGVVKQSPYIAAAILGEFLIAFMLIDLYLASDKTAKKYSEEIDELELFLSEDRKNLMKIADYVDKIFIVINNDGLIEYASEQFCEIAGVDKKKVFGKKYFENYIPKEIYENEKAHFRQVLDEAAEWKRENLYHITNKSGKIYEIIATEGVLVFGEGNKYFIWGEAVKNNSYHAAIESKTFLKTMLDVVPYNVAVLDETGKIIMANLKWRTGEIIDMELYKGYGIGVNFCDRIKNEPWGIEIAEEILKVVVGEKNKISVKKNINNDIFTEINMESFMTGGSRKIAVFQHFIKPFNV